MKNFDVVLIKVIGMIFADCETLKFFLIIHMELTHAFIPNFNMEK